MESHISHIFADLFSSRPKSYSKKGLNKLLTLRLLKENGVDLEQLYLSSLLNKEKTTTTYSSSNYNYWIVNRNLDKIYKDKFNLYSTGVR